MKLLLLAMTLAFLGAGACSSGGGGCDSGGEKKTSSNGESAGLPGGPSAHGTSESVSFQGLGKKSAGEPAPTGAAAKSAAAESALGGSNPTAASGAPQSVICGGFPNLAADCKTDPAFAAVQKKCCPTGTVDQCQAIPGGARLIGRGCTAPGQAISAQTPTAPAPAAAQ